jgi:hypothetical protein
MKVRIKNYPTWLGPYQLVEKIFFWARKEDELGFSREADWVYSIGDWLAHTWFGSWWSKIANKWLSFHHDRRVKVSIDPWDTWGMDNTLVPIILPMLKQLKETKSGAPFVDLEDVPKELHGKKLTKKQKDKGEVDDKHFERWGWVLDEMIWAFSMLAKDDWQSEFYGEFIESKDDPLGGHFINSNQEGRKKADARIDNGLLLFGKYFRCLWD